jgi:DNA-binding NarL/FixJ family response regulator
MALASYPVTSRRPAAPAVPGSSLRSRPCPNVMVVHRADVVRAGVATLLASGADCDVSHAASVYEAVRLAGFRHPQVILFDFTARDGADACGLLGGLWPRPRLIAMVSSAGVTARDCLSAGSDAAAAIDNVTRETFLSLVSRVLDGASSVVAGFGAEAAALAVEQVNAGPISMLTKREREMLFLIGEGRSNKEIADALVLSVTTIETHRANLARKLGIRSRAGLMRLAMAGAVA